MSDLAHFRWASFFHDVVQLVFEGLPHQLDGQRYLHGMTEHNGSNPLRCHKHLSFSKVNLSSLGGRDTRLVSRSHCCQHCGKQVALH